MDEMTLVSAPQVVVQSQIADLEALRIDILNYGENEQISTLSQTEFRRKKYDALLDTILRNILLCQQFLDSNGK
jgi:hypothetical protein